MKEREIVFLNPRITLGAPALRGFWAYEEVYVKSVSDAIQALEGSTEPVTLRSSDEALLQYIASVIYCPLLDNRRILVPSDAAIDRLRAIRTLVLTESAYLDYDEIHAYIEGNRPEWVCFQCASQPRALSFVRYFRSYKSTPLLYIVRDGLCIYIRYRSDSYEYDQLTPDSLELISQMNEDGAVILHEYTRSVLEAKRERTTTSDSNAFVSGEE